MPSSRRALRRALASIPITLLAAGALPAQELRYSLTPSAQWVQWSDALGIDDAYLYGGRAGFTFGQYVELQGFYFTRGRIDARLGELGEALPTSTESSLGIRNYGADLVLNLTTSRLRPFVRAGGSILRFAPEEMDATRQIALRYGGGIRFGNPGQLRVQLFAEDLLFRVNRARLGLLPDGVEDPDAGKIRHNLVYGAGLTVPLGGAAMGDDRPAFGLGNFSLPIEVFGGVLNFADDIGFDGQNLAGVRTGINFGPLVGLRGYYWRGTNDGFSSFAGVESWGGEAQFRLNPWPGISPYLIAGAGQLNFKSGFIPDVELEPVDRTMLILGGGFAIGLTERLNLNLAARNHLFNAEGELTDARRTDDLRSNWMLSAGLGFNIGGSTPSGVGAPAVPPRLTRVDTVYVDQETGEVTRAPAERMVARDTVFLDPRTGAVVRAPGERTARSDTVFLDRRTGAVVRAPDERMLRRDTVFVDAQGRRVIERGGEVAELEPRSGYASERVVQIPVPAEGELYVRYGPARDGESPIAGTSRTAAAGMTEPQLRDVIREVLRDELYRGALGQDASLATPESRELFERRLLDRIDSALNAHRIPARSSTAQPLSPVPPTAAVPTAEERELERQRLLRDVQAAVREQVRLELERREALRESSSPPPLRFTPQQEQPEPAERAERPRPLVQLPPADPMPRSLALYIGASRHDKTQFVTGVRMDVGPVAANVQRIRMVPEFALGMGNGTTGLVAANAQYRPAPLSLGNVGVVGPYAQFGVGALLGTIQGDRQSRLMLNPAYGIEIYLPDMQSVVRTSQLFVEHQGLDLFEHNRLLMGLRWML